MRKNRKRYTKEFKDSVLKRPEHPKDDTITSLSNVGNIITVEIMNF